MNNSTIAFVDPEVTLQAERNATVARLNEYLKTGDPRKLNPEPEPAPKLPIANSETSQVPPDSQNDKYEKMLAEMRPAALIKKPKSAKEFDIDDLLAPAFNTIDKTRNGLCVDKNGKLVETIGPLYEEPDKWNNFKPEPIYIKPGERIKLPKQYQFIRYIYRFDATLYGGAAGGGKSIVLLLSHVVKHLGWAEQGIVNVTTGMFCETFADLQKRQVSLIERWIPRWLGKFYYSKEKYYFRFKAKYGGGKIMFCNLANAEKYRSVDFAYITFDEITLSDKLTVENVVFRLRSDKVKFCSWSAATNPGGIGTKWVYKAFIDPVHRVKPGHSKLFNKWSKGYAFIKCLPTENPFLTDQYYMNLERLNPHLRAAVLHGDWSAFEGQFMDMLNPAVHMLPEMPVADEVPVIMAGDHGGRHPTVWSWWAFYPPDNYHKRGRLVCFQEYSALGKWASNHKRNVWEIVNGYNKGNGIKNIITCVGDPMMWSQKGSTEGDWTVAERYNADDDFGPSFNMVQADNDRPAGWAALANALSYKEKLIDKPNGEQEREIIEPPTVYVMANCPMVWSSLSHLIHSKTKPNDVMVPGESSDYDPGEGPDEADTARYALMAAGIDELVQKFKTNTKKLPAYNPDMDRPSKRLRNGRRANSGAGLYSKF